MFLNFSVQFCIGFRNDQYEKHPVAFNSLDENVNTQPDTKYESHPPFGLLNKNRGDKKLSKWVKQRFNSLGSEGSFRKFQKATNSLRRNNIVSNVKVGHSQQDVCRVPDKIDNIQNIRREHTPFFDDINVDDNSVFDRKFRKLVRMSIIRKYNQALDDVLDADTNPENNKHMVNDDDKSESNNVSYEDEEVNED